MNNTQEKETQLPTKTGTWPEVRGGVPEDADEREDTASSQEDASDK